MPEPTENAPETVDSYALSTDSPSQPVTWTPNRPLKRKQIKAANLLGQSMSAREVASIVKVTEWTIHHWLKQEAFQEAVMEANRQDMADLRATNNRIVRLARDVVEEQLRDRESKARVDIAREIVRSTL